MYNLNELAFEAMLKNAKQTNNGNHYMKLAIDGLSYEYNRVQYKISCLEVKMLKTQQTCFYDYRELVGN